MSKVSIIVPVYNAEKYLHKCIDSILTQTFTDFELILVDDGSKDKSGEICDGYSAQDDRIKVIHQENCGAHLSKLKGFSIATSEYVSFIDSDDWVSPDFINSMYNKAISEHLDIVWCDVMIVVKDKEFISKINYNVVPREMLHRIFRGEVPGWIWNKLIRRSIFNMVEYSKNAGVDMLEDVLYSTILLLQSPKMGYIPEPLYYYNRTNDSALTASHQKNVYYKALPNMVEIYRILQEKKILEEYKNDFSYLAMKGKVSLLLEKNYDDAKMTIPYAHKKLKYYRMKAPISWLYWLGFNGGILGKYIINSYIANK